MHVEAFCCLRDEISFSLGQLSTLYIQIFNWNIVFCQPWVCISQQSYDSEVLHTANCIFFFFFLIFKLSIRIDQLSCCFFSDTKLNSKLKHSCRKIFAIFHFAHFANFLGCASISFRQTYLSFLSPGVFTASCQSVQFLSTSNITIHP